jgi:sialic acid synthase SpsE
MNVYIIGEAGASHGGDLQKAVDLVYAAKDAGADCVKFQIWETDKFIAKSSPFYKSFAKAEMNKQQWAYIKAHADHCGIDFLASAFDIDTVDFLDTLGVKAFKVASGDITFEPLLRHIGSKGKRVYLSTGMANSKEVERAAAMLKHPEINFSSDKEWLIPQPYKKGTYDITFLKCTVDYPCEEENVNLAGMEYLKDSGDEGNNYYIGFSDHTKGYLASCMAVAMEASVIEKHFDLKENDEAIGAKQFGEFVQKVRLAEKIMGSDELKTFPCEEKWKKIARRGENGLRE